MAIKSGTDAKRTGTLLGTLRHSHRFYKVVSIYECVANAHDGRLFTDLRASTENYDVVLQSGRAFEKSAHTFFCTKCAHK